MSIFEALQGDYDPADEDQRYVLTAEDVREIRRMYATGDWRQVDLAEEFWVSQPQISKIVNNKQWKDPGCPSGT